MSYYKIFWKRSFDFFGLSELTEYFVPWLFHFSVLLISFLILIPFGQRDIFVLVIQIYFALAAIPILSSTIRRLYDNNVSRLNILWMFIPIIGQIILITLLFYGTYSVTSKEGLTKIRDKRRTLYKNRYQRSAYMGIRTRFRRRR